MAVNGVAGPGDGNAGGLGTGQSLKGTGQGGGAGGKFGEMMDGPSGEVASQDLPSS